MKNRKLVKSNKKNLKNSTVLAVLRCVAKFTTHPFIYLFHVSEIQPNSHFNPHPDPIIFNNVWLK